MGEPITSIQSLVTHLESRGFHVYQDKTSGATVNLAKRVKTDSQCLTNEGKMSVYILLYDLSDIRDSALVSETISGQMKLIGHTKTDDWAIVEFYSLRPQQLMDDNELNNLESRLIKAWEALYMPVNAPAPKV